MGQGGDEDTSTTEGMGSWKGGGWPTGVQGKSREEETTNGKWEVEGAREKQGGNVGQEFHMVVSGQPLERGNNYFGELQDLLSH